MYYIQSTVVTILYFIKMIFGQIWISERILNTCNLGSFVNAEQELWDVARNRDTFPPASLGNLSMLLLRSLTIHIDFSASTFHRYIDILHTYAYWYYCHTIRVQL